MSTLNPTAYAILGGLAVQPDLSGYDLRKGIQNSIGYFWGESYGQIYPALQRLSAEGLIAPSKTGPPSKSSSKGRRRQIYVLTDAGRAALRQWLALPFQNDPPRNEFLLKLFFSGEVGPSVAAAHIRDVNERNRHMLSLLKQIEASVPPGQESNPHLPYWLLTLGLGKSLTSSALEWGEKALAAISAWQETSVAIPQQAIAQNRPTATRTKPPAKRPKPNATHARKTSVSSRKQVRGKRGAARSERKAAK